MLHMVFIIVCKDAIMINQYCAKRSSELKFGKLKDKGNMYFLSMFCSFKIVKFEDFTKGKTLCKFKVSIQYSRSVSIGMKKELVGYERYLMMLIY